MKGLRAVSKKSRLDHVGIMGRTLYWMLRYGFSKWRGGHHIKALNDLNRRLHASRFRGDRGKRAYLEAFLRHARPAADAYERTGRSILRSARYMAVYERKWVKGTSQSTIDDATRGEWFLKEAKNLREDIALAEADLKGHKNLMALKQLKRQVLREEKDRRHEKGAPRGPKKK